jgi:hypothetical protein
VKRLLASILGVLASIAVAQPKLEAPKGPAVPSPNRTAPAQLSAAASKAGISIGPNSMNALQVVDATGKSVGRWDRYTLIVTIDGKVTRINAFTVDCVDFDNCNAYRSGGMTLVSGFTLYYLSGDCSGTPYVLTDFGTPQVGVGVKEADGSVNVYLADQTGGSTTLTVASSFFNGQCFQGANLPILGLFPVTSVIPVSAFGTAPFFVK